MPDGDDMDDKMPEEEPDDLEFEDIDAQKHGDEDLIEEFDLNNDGDQTDLTDYEKIACVEDRSKVHQELEELEKVITEDSRLIGRSLCAVAASRNIFSK